jgi:flagellar motor switch protein FliG
MAMLDRYKKSSAAMMELVKLIEDSPEPKRTTLLKMIRAEDANFSARVEKRVIDWVKFRTLDPGIFAEALGTSPAKIIAMAMHGEEATLIVMAEKCLGSKFSDYKQEKDAYKTAPPNAGQVDAARKKIIAEARKLEADGAVKLMNYDQIDGDIPSSSPGGELKAEAGSTSGTAKEDGGVPDVESFGMEPPTAGLIGDRLEVYLKKELGIA